MEQIPAGVDLFSRKKSNYRGNRFSYYSGFNTERQGSDSFPDIPQRKSPIDFVMIWAPGVARCKAREAQLMCWPPQPRISSLLF